jgi:hypothetical protein
LTLLILCDHISKSNQGGFMKIPTVRVTFECPDTTLETVDEMAKKAGRNRSAQIRFILSQVAIYGLPGERAYIDPELPSWRT